MPIIIGETGWKASPTGGPPTFRTHPVNQKMYYDRLQAWKAAGGTGPKNIVYFEAFDEPWKQGDDGWGLFNVQRQARFVVQSLFPDGDVGTGRSLRRRWHLHRTTMPSTTFRRSSMPRCHANRYVIYSEATTASDYVPTGLVWDPFVKTFWQPVADPRTG